MGIYNYGNNYGAMEPFGSVVGGVAGFFLVFVLLFYLLMIAFGITSYILEAAGLHSIAKRRGIHNAWLAWIPVGSGWLIGSISDQYQYVAKGRVRNRRKVLLGLQIAIAAILVVIYAAAFALGFTNALDDGVAIGSLLGLIGLLYIVWIVLFLINVVFYYIALYDVYASCEPGNAVLFLVLSILLNVTLPFFVFCNRRKDLGMPPRKAPVQEQPAAPQELPVPLQEQVPQEEPAEPVQEAPVSEPTPEEMPAAPIQEESNDLDDNN